MNPETFFDKFGLLADTPNGVQKLRELILQLAVQGKLVRQDENDEPAAVLLEKIGAEKERLVKEGKAKGSKNLLSIECGDTPYILPEGWAWTKLNQLGDLINGDRGKNYPSKQYYVNSGIPFINAGHLLNGKISLEKMNFITNDKYESLNNGKLLEGDIIYCLRGTLGKCAIFSGIKNGAIASSLVILRLNEKTNSSYIYNFLISPFGKKLVKIFDNGTAQPNLSAKSVSNYPVPLPPLNEQKRIVAKVDQLMVLCDELEARQQKKQETRLRLNSAALDKLLTAHEPVEFAKHWQRVCDNFDLLYDNPETVGELRKAILQLAVQGKLVRQDENDEPAAMLLEKIKAEKERLVKEGIIRKPKPLSWNCVENPCELPANWKWTCLFDIGLISPRNNKNDEMDASFVPMTMISETYSTPIRSEKRLWGEIKKGFTHFAEDDVVLAKITPCFQNGKSAVMRGLLNGFGAGTTELHVFRPLLGKSVNPDYVLLYLKSPQFLTEGIENMTGTAGQKRVPRDYFAGNPFPLPPFEEQRRIVAKVDQLMALCDELEAKLDQSQTDGAKLMGAVVAGLVGA